MKRSKPSSTKQLEDAKKFLMNNSKPRFREVSFEKVGKILFSLEITRLDKKLKIYCKSGGRSYAELDVIKDIDRLNKCIEDLTIASSFMAEILLKYLRKEGRMLSRKNIIDKIFSKKDKK